MGLETQTPNKHDSATWREAPSLSGDCFDELFWKIIYDFCWSHKYRLSWEDFYNHINAKIVSFPYSQNVMNMLYEFITKKADLLHARLFPDFIKNQESNIDSVLIRSVLEEIVSLGKDCYETATADLVYNMYVYDKYTIPGGLCSIFTTCNNTKIMKCEHIPNMDDFSYVSSEEELE